MKIIQLSAILVLYSDVSACKSNYNFSCFWQKSVKIQVQKIYTDFEAPKSTELVIIIFKIAHWHLTFWSEIPVCF